MSSQFDERPDSYARALLRFYESDGHLNPTDQELADAVLRERQVGEAWPVYRELVTSAADEPQARDYWWAYASGYVRSSCAPRAEILIRDARAEPLIAEFLVQEVERDLAPVAPWLARATADLIAQGLDVRHSDAREEAAECFNSSDFDIYDADAIDCMERAQLSDRVAAWYAYERSLQDGAPRARLDVFLLWAAGMGSDDAREKLSMLDPEDAALEWIELDARSAWDRALVDVRNSDRGDILRFLNATGSRIQDEIRTELRRDDRFGTWARGLLRQQQAHPWHGSEGFGTAAVLDRLILDRTA